MKTPFLKRPERISLFVFGFSMISHGLSFSLLLTPEAGGSVRFAQEAMVLIGGSAMGSLAALVLSSHGAFLGTHIVRAFFLVVIGRILGPAHFAIDLFLVLPFLVETSLYLAVPSSLLFNGIVIGVNLAFDVYSLARAPSVALILDTSYVYVLYAATTGLGSRLVQFRETIVEYTHRVTNLTNANMAFQDHAEYVESESAARERSRITRELHDVTAYALTNIAMSMNAAKVLLKDNAQELPELLEVTRKQAEDALQETRKTLYLLRSVEDRKLEGLHAFVHMARQFEAATGVSVQVNYGNVPFSLGREVDAMIYRLIQQGLTNAFRHGKADSVRVNLWRTDTEVRITISDNGVGGEDIQEGIGLGGMRERFATVGGKIETRGRRDGFELSAVIPVEACAINE